MTAASAETQARVSAFDLFSIAVCALCWGTTWYAITLQFGVVDPIISVTYRFALAAALIFAWCVLRREPIGLTCTQHLSALGVGCFTFAIDYAFVYWAEQRVASAVVAVVFASMAFINLIVFRIAFAQRASLVAWAAAGLGVVGVALLSWGELDGVEFGAAPFIGIALTFGGVVGAAIGNAFSWRGEQAGAPLMASTAWAMLYGAGILTVFALATGREWAFVFTTPYVLSLLHLAVNGSVIAFLLYYSLARRRGYATASYVSALTPPIAMLMSSLFEAKTWGVLAFAGIVAVLAGQVLLLRTRKS
ncbi:MAG: EamA family transporter [Hyphomonadaceae bacterium]|nr:EamA family transporter [Hyphomonadaceae bacterium]